LEERLAAQVLIAPAFRIIERYLEALGDFGRERWRREGIYRFVGPWFQFDLNWSVIEDAARYPHERLVRETTLPTLILHGTREQRAPSELSREFAAACPSRPRFVAIEGGDRGLTSHKARIADEIESLIGMLERGEAPCRSQAAS